MEFLESELTDLATSEFDRHLLLLNQTHLIWMGRFYLSNEASYGGIFVLISFAY